MATISVDPEQDPRIITVLAPTTFVSVQELIDLIRDWEDEHLEYPHLVNASGKDDLGGGTAVGITMQLQNAKIAFEARPGPTYIQCTIAGGNTVAKDALQAVMDPIQVTEFTQVVLSQSSSPTIVNTSIAEQVESLKYMVESLRVSHQGYGVTHYVDVERGADTNAGNTPNVPLLTVTEAMSRCTDGAGDVIYIVSPDAAVCVVTENVVVNKTDVHIRGPGRGVEFQPSSGTAITINANNCSIMGFVVRAPALSSDSCIVVNGKFSKLSGLYIVGAGQGVGSGNGIVYRGGDYHSMDDCEIEKCGGSGMVLTDAGLASGPPRELTVRRTAMYLNGSHGAELVGLAGPPYSSTRLNRFIGCNMYNNSGYGISIGANTCGTLISEGHYYNNTLGLYRDLGVDSHIGLTAKDTWDYVPTETVNGSMGKRLKDIKTFATVLLSK